MYMGYIYICIYMYMMRTHAAGRLQPPSYESRAQPIFKLSIYKFGVRVKRILK